MDVRATKLDEVLEIRPEVFGDDRGYFSEAFNLREFEEATGIRRTWVQDNVSRSAKGVLRGIHYQLPEPQGKLVRCASGAIFDVAVDLRRSSPSFLEWVAVVLNADDHNQLWVPEGFGHAFYVLSESADVAYKTTEYYEGSFDRSVAWDDPTIGIEWPANGSPALSDKDRTAPTSDAAVLFD